MPDTMIGHNQPPDPLLAEAAERVDSANRWLKERGDWQAWDKELADKANAFIGQITGTFDALDGRRLDEGREFKKKQDAVYKSPLALLTLAKEKLVPLRRAWLKREDDRLQEERRKAEAEAAAARKAAEEAERKAQEALTKKGGDPLRAELAAQEAKQAAEQAALAAETMPDRAVISGSYSQRATGLKTVWKARVVNLGDALRSYKKNPVVLAAIEEVIVRVATKEAVAAKDPAKAPKGIEYFSEKV